MRQLRLVALRRLNWSPHTLFHHCSALSGHSKHHSNSTKRFCLDPPPPPVNVTWNSMKLMEASVNKHRPDNKRSRKGRRLDPQALAARREARAAKRAAAAMVGPEEVARALGGARTKPTKTSSPGKFRPSAMAGAGCIARAWASMPRPPPLPENLWFEGGCRCLPSRNQGGFEERPVPGSWRGKGPAAESENAMSHVDNRSQRGQVRRTA